MLRIAYNCLPDRFADGRHLAIVDGFRRHGYTIRDGYGVPRSRRDVLLTWTVHHGHKQKLRDDFEAAGGRVVVCEESYVKKPRGVPHFAMAFHDHQGAGNWYVGGPERWRSWDIEIAPWRHETPAGHILVREQRGIGSTLQRCPANWHESTAQALRAYTDREIRIRLHPKHDPDPTPDIERFRGCHALLSWNSSMVCAALLAGIPVIVCAPACIVESACGRGIATIERPLMPDTRAQAFERAAWAQWSIDEIRTGAAASYLLSVAE